MLRSTALAVGLVLGAASGGLSGSSLRHSSDMDEVDSHTHYSENVDRIKGTLSADKFESLKSAIAKRRLSQVADSFLWEDLAGKLPDCKTLGEKTLDCLLNVVKVAK